MADNFLRLVFRGAKFDKNITKNAFKSKFDAPVTKEVDDISNNNSGALNFFSNPTPSTTTTSTSTPTNSHKRSREDTTGDSDDETGETIDDIDDQQNALSDEEEEAQENNEIDGEQPEDEDEDGITIVARKSTYTPPTTDESSSTSTPTALQQLKSIRKQHAIHLQGTDIPVAAETFTDLLNYGIPQYLIDNLIKPIQHDGCGFEKPTPVQMQAIPILCKGRELLACAPTGSGKTAAFVIPILTMLKSPGKHGIRAIVLSPTRELSEQTYRTFQKLSHGKKFKIYHLSKTNANENTFGRHTTTKKDILVTTPMRLVHMIEHSTIDLSK